MYELTVRDHVMIAHSLPDPFFGPAAGLHGATFVVEVTWSRPELDAYGVVIDIGEASARLAEVLGDLNYRNLDEHPAFTGRFSTTEVVAGHICDRLGAAMDLTGFTALAVTLREHPDAWATCRIEL
ncbi:MAG: 6-carboxytetrahydropterin synthase [Micropruina sp.]|nr:6-carboxytetrahydropterin synthase [Micropruina sp.]